LVLASLLAILGQPFSAPAQEHRSTRDGVYTDAQADRGEASYKKLCASCHGQNLQGSGAVTPRLAGEAFLMKWTGDPLDDLFEQIQISMPADRPGTLARSDNADILAYILKFNKFPAGKSELPSDVEALKRIQFDAALQ
jgi:S-disulfanyl-L-cysteine oxidoreductase SoxD